MLLRRNLGERRVLAAVLAAALMAACGNGGGSGSSGGPSAGTGTAAVPAGPVKHVAKRAEGSAAALSNDGQRVYVADEAHEVMTTSMARPRRRRSRFRRRLRARPTRPSPGRRWAIRW